MAEADAHAELLTGVLVWDQASPATLWLAGRGMLATDAFGAAVTAGWSPLRRGDTAETSDTWNRFRVSAAVVLPGARLDVRIGAGLEAVRHTFYGGFPPSQPPPQGTDWYLGYVLGVGATRLWPVGSLQVGADLGLNVSVYGSTEAMESYASSAWSLDAAFVVRL